MDTSRCQVTVHVSSLFESPDAEGLPLSVPPRQIQPEVLFIFRRAKFPIQVTHRSAVVERHSPALVPPKSSSLTPSLLDEHRLRWRIGGLGADMLTRRRSSRFPGIPMTIMAVAGALSRGRNAPKSLPSLSVSARTT